MLRYLKASFSKRKAVSYMDGTAMSIENLHGRVETVGHYLEERVNRGVNLQKGTATPRLE